MLGLCILSTTLCAFSERSSKEGTLVGGLETEEDLEKRKMMARSRTAAMEKRSRFGSARLCEPRALGGRPPTEGFLLDGGMLEHGGCGCYRVMIGRCC